MSFGGDTPVFSQDTKSGFRQRVFVMYHGTDAHNVNSILRRGFRLSLAHGNLLGAGIYVSRDADKTLNYGDVCLKLLVYPGRVKRVTDEEDPLRTTWNKHFGSAWVPPNCNLAMIPSGYEENCVKSKSQIRVLGISRGYQLLHPSVRALTHDVTGSGRGLSKRERQELHGLLEAQGILYCHLANERSHRFLERTNGPRNEPLVMLKELNIHSEGQLWTRSWDGCIENKADGSLLEASADGRLVLSYQLEEGKHHRFKIDAGNKLVNINTNRTVCTVGNGPDLFVRRYNPSNDRWRFVSYGDDWLLGD